jgi:hypothetical protein
VFGSEKRKAKDDSRASGLAFMARVNAWCPSGAVAEGRVVLDPESKDDSRSSACGEG